ncbi:GUN4 domain-containing protein [Cylindrospermopsis raciborskii UAM/DH-BiRr]|uniref:GUN4 domain-containing protein n=1 Tax=Cylindrospermopsis raciborskii TaxID=77022 RepID=UPI003878FA6B
MKTQKFTQLVIIGIIVAFITIPSHITLALRPKEIADIATQVTIRITGISNGSGVIIGKNGNTYTVLTNSHVFENHPTGKFEIITPDGRKHQLNNLRKIANLDLATLEFNSIQEYRVVELGDSNRITRGEDIYVSGFPANQDLNFSSDRITRIITKARPGGYALVYRIGAFPGMSGGPILDSDGKLVGIHGETQSVSLGIGRSTPEEYGIPLQTFLNATSISRSSPPPITRPSPSPSPSPTPTFTPSPPPSPSRYTKLETLLKAQDFREADLETDRVMLAVANRQSEGWLRIEDAENFPCKELRTIDNLWLKYSQGKFGISVQQEIYKNLGGTKQYNEKVWESFGDRVGWRKQGSWLITNDLNFSLSAPTGQLPTTTTLLLSGDLEWSKHNGIFLHNHKTRDFPPVKTCRV